MKFRKFNSLILALLMVCACAVSVNAQTYTSSANGNSKKVTYNVTVRPTRTGPYTASVAWSISPSWTSGGEGHGSPTRITAKIWCGNNSKTVTIKNSGSNSLHSHSGTWNVAVSDKATSVSAGFNASGSGSYTTKKTVTYTYYTTRYNFRTLNESSHGGNGGGGGWHYHYDVSYSVYKSKKNSSTCVKWTDSVKHTGTKTVTETHHTNSGSHGTVYPSGSMKAWYWVRYDAVGGSPTPAQHGFIGGNSTTIKGKADYPKYWCEEIKKYGYTAKGWSTTRYTPNSGTPIYTGGETWSNDLPSLADLQLYAVYTANMIGKVTYHANGGNEDSVPSPQNKYYNVPLTLSTKIPTYPEDDDNRGYRHVFLYWNTKCDGSGITYQAGSVFNLNYNPHEEVPQDNINLYAIWYHGLMPATESPDLTPNKNGIRYIDQIHESTLGIDSKWRSGERQKQLNSSLKKDGSVQAKSVYDSEGNKIK